MPGKTPETAGGPESFVEEGYEYWRQKYADGRIENWRRKVETGKPAGDWEQTPDTVDKDLADVYQAGGGAKGAGATQTVKTDDGRVLEKDPQTGQWKEIPGTGPTLGPKQPDTVTATDPRTGQKRTVTTAQAAQERVETQDAFERGKALAAEKRLNQAEIRSAAEAERARLQTLVSLGQLSQQEMNNELNRWKSGVEAAQAEKRIALEQQQTSISAGNLGVSRGSLGVSQQNADTQREQVIQSAADSAVKNTIELMSQYMKVGPGFGEQFAAGVNMLSGGGGKMNITPDAFMNPYVPDLNAIRDQAVTEAISRLKGGGMAPATAAAVNTTALPGPVAPASVGAPPTPAAPAVTAQQITQQAAAAGVVGTPTPVPQNPMPAYTGPRANQPY